MVFLLHVLLADATPVVKLQVEVRLVDLRLEKDKEEHQVVRHGMVKLTKQIRGAGEVRVHRDMTNTAADT